MYGRGHSDPNTTPGWDTSTYVYGDPAHVHAVTGVQSPESTNTYEYDANGNMIERVIDGTTYTLVYNGENRLSSITKHGPPDQTWTFEYDGDGNSIKQVNSDSLVILYLLGGQNQVDNASSKYDMK